MKIFLVLGFLVLSSFALDDGAMKIKVDGQDETIYVVSGGSSHPNIIVTQNSVTMKGGSGVNFAKEPINDFQPTMYREFNLVGKRLSFTVDNSKVYCSCNSAIYLVSMPGYDSNSKPDPSQAGNYYCDANKVAGNYCPEFDISEANMYAMATTAHRCSQPRGKHFDWCDGSGCGKRVWDYNSNALCPENHCTINTQKSYRHHIDFETDSDGVLYNIRNILEQEGRTVTYDTCTDRGYLRDIDGNMKAGMVFDLSQWGNSYDTMKWLDGETGCQGDCNLAATETKYSNFEIGSIPAMEESE